MPVESDVVIVLLVGESVNVIVDNWCRELLEISHIRTIYHIFVAILIVFMLNTFVSDIMEHGRSVCLSVACVCVDADQTADILVNMFDCPHSLSLTGIYLQHITV